MTLTDRNVTSAARDCGEPWMESPSLHETFGLPARGCLPLSVLTLIFFLALLVDSCVSRDVVAKATSPDGSAVARLYEINGGATTDFAYSVQISRPWPRWDSQVADFYGAVRSDCAYGVDMKWTGNARLELRYLETKSSNVEPSANVGGKAIRIVPRPNTTNPAAPCGGMLYNQQGRPHDPH